jgi:predicted TIM-barrel enzyme
MSNRFTREEVLARLNAEIDAGRPVVIVGAGTGISAKFAEKGGADLIGVYNSGLFRMNGHGSLAGLMPYADGNQIVLDLGGRTVLPVVQNTPVIGGICGTDPTREMPVFLAELQRLGISGVMNFPTVGLIDWDSRFRQELEDTGMGYDKEMEALKIAKDMGLFTMGYAFRPEEGAMVGAAGLDVVIAHLGLTRGGSIGSEYSKDAGLAEAAKMVDAIGDAAKAENPDILVFSHGGAIAYPDDTQYIYDNTQSVGFLGASSAERIPVEEPLRAATAAFKAAKLPKKA